jgi:hypothetical protein
MHSSTFNPVPHVALGTGAQSTYLYAIKRKEQQGIMVYWYLGIVNNNSC